MECAICIRAASSNLPFHCTTCARSVVYDVRLQKAQALLERAQLASQIAELTSLKPTPAKKLSKEESRAVQRWAVERSNTTRAQSQEKIFEAERHVHTLREELKAARLEIQSRKDALRKRRTEQEHLQTRVIKAQEQSSLSIQEGLQKATLSWEATNQITVDTRKFLCTEAAHIFGLSRRKKLKGGVVREQYWLGGALVVPLKDINNARCNELNASMTNVARLVVLIAFYLSMRLPAEIVLPQRDHPLPTILTPANSYQGREASLPMAPTLRSSVLSIHNSPTDHIHSDKSPAPRPRPLFIEPESLNDKVPRIAKSDPNTFSFFLEGISLLAWDVAWLCRSQGLNAGTESWEEVCMVGQNLWNLLFTPSQSSVPTGAMQTRRKQGPEPEHTMDTDDLPARPSSGNRTDQSFQLGSFSHNSAYSFTHRHGHGGADPLSRGWKVTKYTMIADPLRKALLSEMSNAEWEVLEQEEWKDAVDQPEYPKSVQQQSSEVVSSASGKAASPRLSTLPGADRITSDAPTSGNHTSGGRGHDANIGGDAEADKGEAGGQGCGGSGGGGGGDDDGSAGADETSRNRNKGTSGWTKLKNRDR